MKKAKTIHKVTSDALNSPLKGPQSTKDSAKVAKEIKPTKNPVLDKVAVDLEKKYKTVKVEKSKKKVARSSSEMSRIEQPVF